MLGVKSESENSLPPQLIDACYRQWSDSLRRFAWTVTRDRELASDAVQIAFLSLAQVGGGVAEPARKAWLYKAVFRQAVRLRETRAKDIDGLLEGVIEQIGPSGSRGSPLVKLVEAEDLERIAAAMKSLPLDQQQIVQLRIYDELTFAEIAKRIGVPLGTALSRMRLAIEKIRAELATDEK